MALIPDIGVLMQAGYDEQVERDVWSTAMDRIAASARHVSEICHRIIDGEITFTD